MTLKWTLEAEGGEGGGYSLEAGGEGTPLNLQPCSYSPPLSHYIVTTKKNEDGGYSYQFAPPTTMSIIPASSIKIKHHTNFVILNNV